MVYLFTLIEDESPAIIFYVHQPVQIVEGIDPLLGFKPPKLPSSSIPLHINQTFIFGRGEGAGLFLNDDSASRVHMELSAYLNMVSTPQASPYLQFIVRNLSKKPVIINGTVLKENQQRLLNSSDVIKIGLNTFTVDINPTNFTSEGQYILEVQILQQHQQIHNGMNVLPANQIYHQSVGYGMPPQGMMQYPGVMPQQGMGLLGMAPPPPNIPGFQHQGVVPPHPGMGYQPHNLAMQYPHIPQPGAPFMQPHLPMQHGIPSASNRAGNFAHNFITGNHYAQPTQEAANLANQSLPSSQQEQSQQQISSTSPLSGPPRPERQISAQERREAYGQSRGSEASENDELGESTNVSMEETSKLTSETSFEETEPPKDKD